MIGSASKIRVMIVKHLLRIWHLEQLKCVAGTAAPDLHVIKVFRFEIGFIQKCIAYWHLPKVHKWRYRFGANSAIMHIGRPSIDIRVDRLNYAQAVAGSTQDSNLENKDKRLGNK